MIFSQESLNEFIGLKREAWIEARLTIQKLLKSNCSTLRDDSSLRQKALVNYGDVKMHLPAIIGDYTDFYSSENHARNVGIMFRGPDNALMPNWFV